MHPSPSIPQQPHDKWICECGHIANSAGLLTAPSPFDPSDVLTGCPACKAVDKIHAACAAEGCKNDGNCGGPDESGVYRFTCYRHSPHFPR